LNSGEKRFSKTNTSEGHGIEPERVDSKGSPWGAHEKGHETLFRTRDCMKGRLRERRREMTPKNDRRRQNKKNLRGNWKEGT